MELNNTVANANANANTVSNANADEKCCICDEKINRSTRLKITCEYCPFEACRVCCETYILTQTNPHCMNSSCNKIWTRKFMARAFTDKFMSKRYKQHREQILFEQEQALMPETQALIERDLYKERMIQKTQDELFEVRAMLEELGTRKFQLERQYRRLKDNTFQMGENAEEFKDDTSREARKFLYKCTGENCRGFLSSRWKCNLCQTKTCPDCRVNMGTDENKKEHVCNSDDVETVKLLKNDSKPCPNCGVVIFKIVGCDQMFCTQCHTPFSWKTGEKQTGRNIHNPHYFEYLRTRNESVGRNPLDMPCGRQLDQHLIHAFKILMRQYWSDTNTNKMLSYCENISHLSEVDILGLNNQIDNYGVNNQNHRIMYLKNVLTEKQFKKNIQMNEKKKQKQVELLDLYTMVRDVTTDIIRKCYEELSSISNLIPHSPRYSMKTLYYGYEERIKTQMMERNVSFENVSNELMNIRNYANACMVDIQKTYKGTLKQFNDSFKMVNDSSLKFAESLKPADEIRVIEPNNTIRNVPKRTVKRSIFVIDDGDSDDIDNDSSDYDDERE